MRHLHLTDDGKPLSRVLRSLLEKASGAELALRCLAVIGGILVAPFLPLLALGVFSYLRGQEAWWRLRFPYDLKP